MKVFQDNACKGSTAQGKKTLQELQEDNSELQLSHTSCQSSCKFNNLKITTNISYPFIHVKKFRDFRNFMIYVKFMKGYPKWSRDFDDDFNRQILNVKGWSLGN